MNKHEASGLDFCSLVCLFAEIFLTSKVNEKKPVSPPHVVPPEATPNNSNNSNVDGADENDFVPGYTEEENSQFKRDYENGYDVADDKPYHEWKEKYGLLQKSAH